MRKITRNRHKRAKQAASEVMGAVLLLGVTLAVGFAVWAYARGAASNAEKSFGNDITSNIACMNLNFVVVNVNFNTVQATDQLVTVWFYSTSSSVINVTSVTFSNSTTGGAWTYVNHFELSRTNTTVELQPSTVTSFTINVQTQLSPNKLYSFQAEALSTPLSCSIYTSQYNQVTPNISPV